MSTRQTTRTTPLLDFFPQMLDDAMRLSGSGSRRLSQQRSPTKKCGEGIPRRGCGQVGRQRRRRGQLLPGEAWRGGLIAKL
jgi:hypothetical protein